MAAPANLSDLRLRLKARCGDLEQAVLARVNSISAPHAVADPTYLHGLRGAVLDAIDYALDGIERSEERPAPVPVSLLAQARLAARSGVGLDTVLRRYSAGHAVLNAHLIEVIGGESSATVELERALRVQAALFDRLIDAVAAEHGRELSSRPATPRQRRADLVRRLLDGGLALGTSELGYGLEGYWHLGVITEGEGAEEVLHHLARAVDCLLLAVPQPDGTVWGWFGGRRPGDRERWAVALAGQGGPGTVVALGELGRGLFGWRLTHRQARAAFPFAKSRPERIVRYADVAVLASAMQDDLLMASLHELFLRPLDRERDGGETARRTLRAYFAAGRQVTSAAATLGVNRKTVSSRLAAIEVRIGRPLSSCVAELEAALRLEEVRETASSSHTVPR